RMYLPSGDHAMRVAPSPLARKVKGRGSAPPAAGTAKRLLKPSGPVGTYTIQWESGDHAIVLLSSSPCARTRSFEPSSEMTRSSLRLRMKAMLLPSGDHIGAVSISTP